MTHGNHDHPIATPGALGGSREHEHAHHDHEHAHHDHDGQNHAGHDDRGHDAHDHSGHAGHDHLNHSGHAGDEHGALDHSGHDAHDHADHGADDHSSHDHSSHAAHGHAGHDRSAHDHSDHASHAGHDHAGHGAHDHSGHAGHDPAIFRRKFWLSLVLTIPTLVFSHGLQEILGLDGPRFPGSDFIPAVFGTILFFYGGLVFLRGGVDELKQRAPGMMTLISLAIVVAFGYSLAVTLGLSGMDFWWELSTLITIMLLGHWIEMGAVMSAGNALGALASLLPDTAERVIGESGGVPQTETVHVSELASRDVVLVRPGQAIPADGVVVDGSADVDRSLLTGESAPVRVGIDDSVVAGSTVAGALSIRVTQTGEGTALAGIMRLVSDAQASKSGAQLLADRAAKYLFYVAIAFAVVTAVAWAVILPGDPGFTLERVVTVLIIACPHALGLAIPLVAQISTALGARAGVLVRDRAALEDARRIDVVLFDKTGTLTYGRQGVADIVAIDGDADTLLACAAAVEARSEHPIGRGIVTAATDKGLTIPRAEAFESLAGRGVAGVVDSRRVAVLSPGALAARGPQPTGSLATRAAETSGAGRTVVWVVDESAHLSSREAGATGATAASILGFISLADVVRPESAEAVAALKRYGVRVAMVSGDARGVAESVAAQLGIDEVLAEVLPEDKARSVRDLQKDGSRVAMVGDGVNDAPALAQADVGIAIGAGTDVALEAAGIVLASDDTRAVLDVLVLSKATYRKMLQNLAWAAGYNVISLPLAAGVAIGAGILVSPAVGAVLMSLSTIVVAVNAQLLRRLRLGAAARPSRSAGISTHQQE